MSTIRYERKADRLARIVTDMKELIALEEAAVDHFLENLAVEAAKTGRRRVRNLQKALALLEEGA